MPKVGDTVINTNASVQFKNPFPFRITGVAEYGSTPTGWVWLTGYIVDTTTGLATGRRELFVQTAGLQTTETPLPAPARPARMNRGPQPRTNTRTPARSHR
jgi:hypothetical protein